MRRLTALALLLVLLLTGCGRELPREGVTFTDDTQTDITVPYAPQKVAVLTSSLADLWITAGGTVEITVGESLERGLVEEAVLVDEGAGKTVDLERLIQARPDFVLYSAELAGQRECAGALMAAGIPAAGFSLETFGDYLELLELSTRILGTPDNYALHGEALRQEVDRLTALAQQQPQKKRILFVRAGSTAKVTKAKTFREHFVCVMLKELGTENIAEQAPVLLDGLSTEHILLADPDVIFFTTMGDEAAGAAYMQSVLDDPALSTLTAVEEGQVFQLPKELFQYKPNSRWDEAYAYLIRLLYGDIL